MSTYRPLEGQTAVIFGVANKHSIAWGVAQAWSDAGARLIFGYQDERIRESVAALAQSLGPDHVVAQCDVSSDEQIDAFAEIVRQTSPTVHHILHSVAFAPKEFLEGNFSATPREAFLLAQNISVYSLIGVTRALLPLMTEGGSIVTMSFYGAQKVFPHYNVMGVCKAALEATVRYLAMEIGIKGIRVNAISAGPVNTLAARGISGFRIMLKFYQHSSPMRRSCDQNEVGQTALFLATPGAAAITGQTIFVDGGYEVMGMPHPSIIKFPES